MKIAQNRGVVGVGIVGLLAASGLACAQPSIPAEFTVTGTVVWDDIEPVGVNLTGLTGGTNLGNNNLIFGGGMEPGEHRTIIRVERAGPGWIEWDQSIGGVHSWDQYATGFGDGATLRLYRIVDAQGQPLSYENGANLANNAGADHVISLGEVRVPDGGWVAEGSDGDVNRVYLDDPNLQLQYGDHVVLILRKTRLTADEVHPRLHQWFNDDVHILRALDETLDADLVPHPGAIPSGFDDPGETCLQLTASDAGYAGQYLFHAYDQGEGQWYSQLEPGAAYRAEVWLRQEGVPGGAVSFRGRGPYSGLGQDTPWAVTDQWQKFSFDFAGPEYPEPGTFHGALGLFIGGPGTVWVDNFVVYRNDEAHGFQPFTPHEIAFDELMAALPTEGPKGAVRFFTETYYAHAPMERMLSNFSASVIDPIYNVGATRHMATVPIALNWAYATGESPETRVVPNITLSEEYDGFEYAQLVEYLGVPYDPAVDTPDSKPWAHRRFTQRGHGRPWTDEFKEIIIEFGNETWHAGVLAGWDGFGRPGWVHHGGREYGLFARFFFTEHVMAQPFWSEHDLGDKIKFCLNANYDAQPTSYGEAAAQAAPQATTYLGHANYVGPTWETGDTPFQSFDDHGMQETLVGAVTGMYPLIEQVEQTRASLQSQGLANYRPVAYEGGPSGYYLPGSGTADQVAISQRYGKSLGMGVAALDVWLYSSLHGYRHQFMYGFRVRQQLDLPHHATRRRLPSAQRVAGAHAPQPRDRLGDPGGHRSEHAHLRALRRGHPAGHGLRDARRRHAQRLRPLPQARRPARRRRLRRRHYPGDHQPAGHRGPQRDAPRHHRARRLIRRPAREQHRRCEYRPDLGAARPRGCAGRDAGGERGQRRPARRHATGHRVLVRHRAERGVCRGF